MQDTSPAARAAKPSNSVAFSYRGRNVLCDVNGLVSLTDMWQAAGSPADKDPGAWGQGAGVDFIEFIATHLDVSKGRIFKARGSKEARESWGHRQVAIAYAKYLSNEFHAFVNQGFIEWADENQDPALKVGRAIEAYRRQGKDRQWIEGRVSGMSQRRSLAATMKRHECRASRELNPFAEGTRAITRELFGLEPHQMRESRGVTGSAGTRDQLDRIELARLYFAESEAENLIKVRNALGNEQCIEACRDAARAVREAIATLYPPHNR